MNRLLTIVFVAGFALTACAQQKKDNTVETTQSAAETTELAVAPDFTFKNLTGEDVSLSSFRGKWVIVDFWGSWCGWCIKGMPEMKKVYEQYKGKLEIIGVDCYDSENDWRTAVDRLQLPWINLYNPQREGGVLADYNIQGFPSKAIINPEGKIAKFFVGEDPEFYTTLAELIK